MLENKYGRWFVKSQLNLEEQELASQLPALKKKRGQWWCGRCANQVKYVLPSGKKYCRVCLVFGRVTEGEPIYYFKQDVFPKNDYLTWKGQLTPYQKEVSDVLLKAVDQKEAILVHAVTGAGKTEMIYQTLNQELKKGHAIALVSPRRDVCVELHKRLSKDFSCSISLLHGESERYVRSPLVIATTHQLLKFYRAFDLIIIDEVDAFPFVDNKMLYHAVDSSLKKEGVKVFLTATSTDELDKQVRKKVIKKVDLARRFHSHPLVVPKTVWLGDWKRLKQKQRLSKKWRYYFERQRKTGYPLLIFYPNIEEGSHFVKLLSQLYPEEAIGFVSSQTLTRSEQVEAFRTGKLNVLVATTILERGVTFPCVDVFVLEANHRLFQSSSLVQISGRVGRASERPYGELLFFHDGISRAMKKAIREIKVMNKKGGF